MRRRWDGQDLKNWRSPAATLSGGWKKRLAIAEALVQNPDILLLDEPTNHLDLAGIEWLESLLERANFASVVVSHDRYFLENVTNEMVEIDRAYEDGALRVRGNYSAFLEAKEEHLHAQRNRQEALENRVHTEIEWLRRGPKARATKAKARIEKAHKMIGELAEMKTRSNTSTAQIDFSATNRQAKQLIELDEVSCAIGDRVLFEKLHFRVTSGMRVGLVGPNGSGKTTLLRLLRGDLQPIAGKIRKADPLRMVYFDQNRELDPDLLLRRALAPDSDAVIYQDQVIHVASWAARFLFTGEDLNRRVGKLSGGERARVLIAQLMLQPADVLLLDEPTNDLDIPTLEILEESLLEFRGALDSRDARSLHARPRFDDCSWVRRIGRDGALCGLFAMGDMAGIPTGRKGKGKISGISRTFADHAGFGKLCRIEKEAFLQGVARAGGHGAKDCRRRNRSSTICTRLFKTPQSRAMARGCTALLCNSTKHAKLSIGSTQGGRNWSRRKVEEWGICRYGIFECMGASSTRIFAKIDPWKKRYFG